jgi:DNA-binding response OmpR family regulator
VTDVTDSLSKGRILVADDEINTRQAFVRALQLMGYEAVGVDNGASALSRLAQEPFDLLLLDLQMPGVDGVQVMQALQELAPDLAVIVLTAHATLPSAITAIKSRASDYLIKPQRISDIEQAIRKALQNRATHNQRQRLREIIEQAMQVLGDEKDPVSPPANPDSGSSVGFDPLTRQVSLPASNGDGPRQVELTEGQAAIFSVLFAAAGRVQGSQEIAFKALGYPNLTPAEAERIVRPHILRLRARIEPDPAHPCLVRTVRGAGYIFYPPGCN